MSDQSSILSLPYIQASQAQKHVTHNEALQILDTLVQTSVLSQSLDTPPAAPAEGDTYLIANAPTGVWAAQALALATWQGDAWLFLTPKTGWRVWVADDAELVIFDGTDWAVRIPELQNLPQLGINATADATNRLSVAADATLLNHDGSNHLLKINKSASTDTASLLFQDGFSGRAEMGLTGNDDFNIKVSADGATWTDAVTIKNSTGFVGIGTQNPAVKLEVIGDIQCISLTETSDIRLKTNIAAAKDPGTLIDEINVVQYDWVETGNHVAYGLVAQELAQLLPDLVAQGDAKSKKVKMRWGVRQAPLVALLIREVQSLRTRITALEAK